MILRLFRRQRVTAFDRFADAIRVLIALSGVILYAALGEHNPELMPLMLGVIAAGMAETNDGWPGRARTLLFTLAIFGVVAFAIGALVSRPWVFPPLLGIGVFTLAMLRAAGASSAIIANAALTLAVYTMISATQNIQAARLFWFEPLWLFLGAAWYGLVALAWNATFRHRPVRHSLARLYAALGDHLIGRSWLVEPVRDPDATARRSEMARINARVVDALADTRRMLTGRRFPRRSHSVAAEYRRLYRAAQDIHERADAIHYPYAALVDTFFHSDVLFRCQRLLRTAGKACRGRAAATRYNEAYTDDGWMASALADFDAALDYRRIQAKAGESEGLRALDGMADNLRTLTEDVGRGAHGGADDDIRLQEPWPRSSMAYFRRIRAEFTPASAWFRHALRLALAILAGYAILLAVHPTQGYWILLTALLVCQPDYANTRTRVAQRFGGTVAGLLIAWAGMRLFPDPGLQLGGIVVAAMVFFVARFRRYAVATAGISVFALMSFNQIGDGFDLIWPRLVDTLIGGALAVLVMLLVMPDWRERELRRRLATALAADAGYLRALSIQYRAGRSDDRGYRGARRDAQAANAAVSSHVSMARSDPHGDRADSREALAVLACTQTLLGHLSTLGAHREKLNATDTATFDDDMAYIAGALERFGGILTGSVPASFDVEPALDRREALRRRSAHSSNKAALVAAQLGFLLGEVIELHRLGGRLNVSKSRRALNGPARRP